MATVNLALEDPPSADPDALARARRMANLGGHHRATLLAECLMSSRVFIARFIVLMLGFRALARDIHAPDRAAAGITAVISAWASGRLFGHFAWARE